VAYRRIRKEENTDSSSDDDNPEALEKHANMLKLKKRSERRGYLRRKVEAILWTSSMCGVLWYGDKDRNFFTMLLHNVHLNRDYLYIAYALLGVITLIFLYLSIYVTHVRKRNDWEAAEPWAIPTASLLGVVLTFMFMAALWPVYGLLTPVIQVRLDARNQLQPVRPGRLLMASIQSTCYSMKRTTSCE